MREAAHLAARLKWGVRLAGASLARFSSSLERKPRQFFIEQNGPFSYAGK